MTAPSVHGALLVTQLCWGSAAVVNKLGLPGAGISPLLFALMREVSATPILLVSLLIGRRQARKSPKSVSQTFEEKQDTDGDHSYQRLALRILPGFFGDNAGWLSSRASSFSWTNCAHLQG
mmetsp:Transcript_78765/g.205468  ORF Transcript_78765/g.205468 Transcript_78765/m.205468 type:complete len:121 (+) Transcript_78765:59-421(+)